MTRLFLDAEFTNVNDCDLISIALVADGAEFYAELDSFPLQNCSGFVQKTVLPLLGKVSGACMTREVVRTSLHAWLAKIRGDAPEVVVSFDYQGDWKLLIDMLDEAPDWLIPDDVSGSTDNTIRGEFFNLTGLPEHHALYDAKALKFAYRPVKRA